jgi:YYY domain-containing protein
MFRETLGWWLAIEVIGLVALPIAFVLFRRLPDRGYAFAKPLGILLGAYVFWLSLSAHVLSNRPGSVVWCYLAIAAVSALIFRSRRTEIIEDLRANRNAIIAVEVIFSLGLFVAAYLRAFVPEIDGTEKPMDFMFLNAASRSHYYPPSDSWLAGFDVSYYYFGYVIQAMLGKVAAVPTSVAFNLGVAGTAALTITAAFGIGYNLVASGRRATFRMALTAGIAGATLIAFLGNLEGVLEFAKANGVGSKGFFESMGVKDLALAQPSNHWYPSDDTSFWWWWRATRMCADANCILEFPFFSFLLGDMHPHVMAIPFVLMSIGIGFSFWRSERALTFEDWYASPAMLLLTGVLIGALGFLNTWDLPAFGSLLVLIVIARNLRSTGDWNLTARYSLGFVLPLALVAVVAFLPFYVTFHSQAGGLAAVANSATTPRHAAMFWLPLGLVTMTVPIVKLIERRESIDRARVMAVLAVPALVLVVWALVLAANDIGIRDAVSDRGKNWLTALVFAALFCTSALALWSQADLADEADDEPGLVPLLALTTVASLLVLGTEFFFIKDVFGSRLNTVFKLYYQSWLMLGAAGGFGIYWLVQRWAPEPGSAGEALRGAWAGATTLVLIGALLYPLGATLSRTRGLAGTTVAVARPDGTTKNVSTRTLDGMAFVKRNAPDEIGAVAWLRGRAGHEERIAEAVLGQYSAGGRISGRTGVPAVIGWAQHEVQWGRSADLANARAADVDRLYTTDSLPEALDILRKYDVTYVVVGSVEKSKYPASGIKKFSELEPAAYTNGNMSIYRVPLAEPAAPTGNAP